MIILLTMFYIFILNFNENSDERPVKPGIEWNVLKANTNIPY